MNVSDGAIRTLSGATPAQRAEFIAAAVHTLRAGRLVAFPTETVYGLGASAAAEEGPRRLAAATSARRGGNPNPATWHAHSPEFVRETLGLTSPIHQRLVRRLLPGPVTFLVEKSGADLDRIRERLHAVPGTLHNGREMAVRVPDHPAAHALLESAWRAGLPVVADGVAAAGWGTGARLDRPPPPALEALGLALDDGPLRFGRPSTVVRLLAAGDFEVLSEGVLEERYVRKQIERHILFVCTGNTCRSPMAEAIARHVIAERARDADATTRAALASTRVHSAGAGTTGGAPVTRESVEALDSLGIDTGQLSRHTSRELTRQMIADADVIYAMTGSHARMVQAIAPDAAPKVHTLDPAGEDIPDPVGAPQQVYTRTAHRLIDAIRQRLEEPEA